MPELNNTLIGTYYIGILGRSSSVYTLNYHAEMFTDDNSTYKTPILLTERFSTKGALRDRDDF